MTTTNWFEEIVKQKDQLIADTQDFLKIKSILDEEQSTEKAPLGVGIDQALRYLLDKGEMDGFTTKNLDGLAGHIEMGQGDELIGILCHVDVVPEGDGWTSDPYSAEIRDGKIFARGAIDDKGPTMAAYYAMKLVKELNLPLSKRVRLIIGTDEESDWRCVDHYFKHEEMPTMGFAPDADFPIIYAEKGIADFDLVQTNHTESSDAEFILVSIQSGRRYNMVPDFAEAQIQIKGDPDTFIKQYENYLTEHSLVGKGKTNENGSCVLQVEGKSAHGMEPKLGVNAGLRLIDFLTDIEVDQQGREFIRFVSAYFSKDSRGENLGVDFSDDITGDLTINVGKINYSKELGGSLGLNLRYPVTNDINETKQIIESTCHKHAMELRNFSDSSPHHVDKEHVLVKTLQKVYEEQTEERAELLSIGGGTYARSLEHGVAFGPLFPGREDIAHQKDEYIIIEDLVKATAIYAQAIYELAK